MHIVHATLDDLDVLTAIEAASYPIGEAASRSSIEDRIRHFSDFFWILKEDGAVKAFVNGFATDQVDLLDEMYEHASQHNPDGQWQMIFSVVTVPEYRKQGNASTVMRQVIMDAKKAHRKGVVLTCKEALIPFYARFGFENEGISVSNHGNAKWYQMRLVF